MVKTPPAAEVPQAASVNHVTAPVDVVLAVNAWPEAPAGTGLPAASRSWTVMGVPAPAHAPAVKVRGGVVTGGRGGGPAVTVCTCAAGLVSADGLVRLMLGVPGSVSW